MFGCILWRIKNFEILKQNFKQLKIWNFNFQLKMWEIEILFLHSFSRNTTWAAFKICIGYDHRRTRITSTSTIYFLFFILIILFLSKHKILKIKEFQLKYLKFFEFKISPSKHTLAVSPYHMLKDHSVIHKIKVWHLPPF